MTKRATKAPATKKRPYVVRHIPGHGFSRHPIEAWRHADGRCKCDRGDCPNNARPYAAS